MVIAIITFIVLLKYYVIYESHRTVLQRMVLIFAAFTILVQILLAVQFEHYFSYNGQREVCAVIGFLSQWMGSVVYTFTFGITLYLLCIVYVKLRRLPRYFDIYRCSSSCKWITEAIFYLIVIFSPFLYLWIPFLGNGYGLDVAFCWIKSVENKECIPTEPFVTKSFLVVSVLMEVLSFLCLLTVVAIYCVVVTRYKQVSSRPLLSLLCRTLCIMAILFSRSLIAIAENVILTTIHDHDAYRVWTFLAIFVPVSNEIVPLGLLVYAFTIKKKRQKVASCFSITCCLRKPRTRQCLDQLSEGSQTHAKSENRCVPSYTYWNVSYTNGFTSVERGESEQVRLTPSECGSTLPSTNDGYSSIIPSSRALKLFM